MPVEELQTDHRLIGTKQVKKAIVESSTYKVYVAVDAEPHIAVPLQELCAEHGVMIDHTYTMKELGTICNIEVGAAAVALLRI